MLRSSLLFAILFFAILGAHGARTQNKAVTCATCHATEAQSEPQTMMGHALQLAGEDPILNANPKMSVRKGPYTYTIETHGYSSVYSVTDGQLTISLPLHWNFGAGNQTWVLERDGHFYESLVSYYAAIHGLDTTTGDERLTPHTLEEAVGREISQNDAKACFGCHTTNSFADGKLNLAGLHPGVGCEHCHLNANQHLIDAARGNMKSAPADLSQYTSEEQSNFCGQCHRTWEMTVRSHWHGELDVRFQPYRLANSKCYNALDTRISCLACHDPHQPLVRDAASYDGQCLSCHASSIDKAQLHPVAAAKPSMAPACPVATTKCVTCHMPKVQMLGGHLTFTDHEIRVVRPGEPYPD